MSSSGACHSLFIKPMIMSRLTARKFKAVCYYVVSWIILTSCTATLGMSAFGSFNLHSFFFLLQLSIFAGLSHGLYDVIVLQDEMDHRTVPGALLIRSLYYIANICVNYVLCLLLWNIAMKHSAFTSFGFFGASSSELISESGLSLVRDTFGTTQNIATIIMLFLQAHMITFLCSVHKKFGKRVFTNTILGKYQDPVEEDIIFMFVDLRKSTEIAEELGHVQYSNFMKDYYKLLCNCCAENQGEIYQIAGDGAFLTWKTKDCKKQARPINCLHDFTVCLARTEHRFLSRYGVVPSFKAGAHCGKVISTEVGSFGSEMAYHGDVINTTSRIQSLCRKLGKDILVSEELYASLPLPLPHNYICHKEGFFELRGKKREILIFSLNTP